MRKTEDQREPQAGSQIAALRFRLLQLCGALMTLCLGSTAMGQMGVPMPLSPAERQKAAEEREANGSLPNYPQLVDITASTGIKLNHLSSPEAKFIVESMSGGVALIDYDRDGWPDIYFTGAQSVDMAQHGQKARSALFHNNHDGTFTDVTDKAGVAYPCWAMGAPSCFPRLFAKRMRKSCSAALASSFFNSSSLKFRILSISIDNFFLA